MNEKKQRTVLSSSQRDNGRLSNRARAFPQQHIPHTHTHHGQCLASRCTCAGGRRESKRTLFRARAFFRPSHSPPQLLAALPPDPADQLQLAFRIANTAFASRASSLASDAARARAALADRDDRVAALETRLAALRLDARDAEERAARAADAAAAARRENEALGGQVRALKAEVARAEGVRRALLRSLQQGGGGEGCEGGSLGDGGVTPWPDALPPPSGCAPRSTVDRWRDAVDRERLPATTTPVSPPRYAAAASASRGAAATASPPPADGRAFFKAARATIPAHRYDALLAAVRALNAGDTGAAGAVAAAAAALGEEGRHLVPEFESLLARHL